MIAIASAELQELNIDVSWLDAINHCFVKYELNTPKRMAGFIGQCQHESMNFSVLQENLYYSASGLIRTWPTRFNPDTAALYAKNPRMIASKVYANRMGNGDEASGDGWMYRGRGLIQLTGKQMYILCGFAMDIDLVSDPDLLLQEEYAVGSAGWYWYNNNLNKFCDKADWIGLTRAINGGTNGLSERMDNIKKALVILSK
jgi:putative chitinase